MNTCSCRRIVEELGVPTKVVVLRCTRCNTEYNFYPNGDIVFEEHTIASNLIRIGSKSD